MTKNDNEKLAEKIVKLLDDAPRSNGDLSSLFASIEKLNHRLDKLEQSVASPQAALHSQPSHPSQEHFAVAEAVADAIFGHGSKEKACTFEPNGKPCDHCAMCSSRGF